MIKQITKLNMKKKHHILMKDSFFNKMIKAFSFKNNKQIYNNSINNNLINNS